MVRELSQLVKGIAQRLPNIESGAFSAAFDRFASTKVVLIGDGSHGTSEFYAARAAITKRLIEQHGFSIVAIECDWPDARAVDHYTRHHPQPGSEAGEPLGAFNHFPRWMWRNTEVQAFVDWLRGHNAVLAPSQRVMFAGLDVYSMGASLRAVIAYLERTNSELAAVARRRYACLEPWVEDPGEYGAASLSPDFKTCEAEVTKMLHSLLANRLELACHPQNGDAYLDAEMNARLVRDAEQYYRATYYGGAESWNLRDTHMFDVLMRLLKHRPDAKAVVWAHNSHLGDARASTMGASLGELNLGELCRRSFVNPEELSIIGCGTHTGTVAAAHQWDTPMRIMDVLPSRADSYERIMHHTGMASFLLDLRTTAEDGEVRKEAIRALMTPRLERFIGVVYRPMTERASHYMKAILPKQFDAYVWFDETNAVHAFETAQPKEPPSVGETYPFGL